MKLSACFSPADLAWAASAVEQAQQRFPRICPNGLTWYKQDQPEQWTDDDYAMVCLCRCYFMAAEPIKTPGTSSYYLKHRIEQHYNVNGSQGYVHNGSCIVAALACGYPIKDHWSNRLCCDIAISKRSIKELQAFTEEVTEHK